MMAPSLIFICEIHGFPMKAIEVSAEAIMPPVSNRNAQAMWQKVVPQQAHSTYIVYDILAPCAFIGKKYV